MKGINLGKGMRLKELMFEINSSDLEKKEESNLKNLMEYNKIKLFGIIIKFKII